MLRHAHRPIVVIRRDIDEPARIVDAVSANVKYMIVNKGIFEIQCSVTGSGKWTPQKRRIVNWANWPFVGQHSGQQSHDIRIRIVANTAVTFQLNGLKRTQ